jgi:hypothetical protein
MMCCAECFGDAYLRREVIPAFTKQTGNCSFCSSQTQALVQPSDLRDAFELLVGIYTQHPKGRPLLEWLKEDWGLFGHSKLNDAEANQLLAEILDDRDIVGHTFRLSDRCNTGALDGWGKLRSELMHENRFFPKAEFNVQQLMMFLEFLQVNPVDLSGRWYRARIQEADAAYSLADMGAPPKDKALHGRANPAGIPYLYLASTPNTAVSEIRPHTGEMATVAEFSLASEMKIVDLREPRKTISPFMVDEERQLELLRGGIGFLEQLGNELTRPVLPQAAAIHYIPTQYLCEFIKKSGYNGVMYRSSVGDGVNIALFEPSLANILSASQTKVSRVSVELGN